MGQKDLETKKLEDYPDVFADILNTLLFEKDYIRPEQLKDGPTESIYKAEYGEAKDQFRDTLKYVDDAGIMIAELGMENQVSECSVMPVRVMNYDSQAYKRQIAEKVSLRPVITIVLNFSNRQWGSTPRKLSELFHVPEELKPFFQDYEVKVFDIAYLPDETINSFKSTFKQVAHFFVNKRKLGEKNYKPLDEEIEHIGAFLDLLKTFTGDGRYKEIESGLLFKQREGGKVTMCGVIDAYIERGRKQGILQGIAQGIEQGIEQGVLQGIAQKSTEFALLMLADSEPIEKIMRYTGLSQKEIDALQAQN